MFFRQLRRLHFLVIFKNSKRLGIGFSTTRGYFCHVIFCYRLLSFLLFLRLRKDLEEAAIQQEATILSLKKKHQDAIAEMSEQIDQLNKLKTKAETEKAQ